MNKTDMFALIALIAAGLGYFMFRMAWPKDNGDKPGPHNNWRSKKNTIGSSGWTESEQGHVVTGGGEGGAD